MGRCEIKCDPNDYLKITTKPLSCFGNINLPPVQLDCKMHVYPLKMGSFKISPVVAMQDKPGTGGGV